MYKYNGGGSFTDMCEKADSKGITSWDAYKDNNCIMRARVKFVNANNNSTVYFGVSSELSIMTGSEKKIYPITARRFRCGRRIAV